MTEPTDTDDLRPFSGTIYRFLILALLAIIALSSVLIVIGLNKPRFVASVCGARGNQIFIFLMAVLLIHKKTTCLGARPCSSGRARKFKKSRTSGEATTASTVADGYSLIHI